jgi:hypothetical protein
MSSPASNLHNLSSLTNSINFNYTIKQIIDVLDSINQKFNESVNFLLFYYKPQQYITSTSINVCEYYKIFEENYKIFFDAITNKSNDKQYFLNIIETINSNNNKINEYKTILCTKYMEVFDEALQKFLKALLEFDFEFKNQSIDQVYIFCTNVFKFIKCIYSNYNECKKNNSDYIDLIEILKKMHNKLNIKIKIEEPKETRLQQKQKKHTDVKSEHSQPIFVFE